MKEPTFTQDTSTESNLGAALNYYSQEHSWDDSKTWALAALKDEDAALAARLSSLPAPCFKNRGFLCRMKSRGFVLSEKRERELRDFFLSLTEIKLPQPEKEAKRAAPAVTVKINAAMQSLDAQIDAAMMGEKVPALSLTDNKKEVQEVADYCEEILQEIAGDDEGYYARETVKAITPILTKAKAAADAALKTINAIKRIARTPRKIKPATMVKKVRYARECAELKLKSVAVTSVIGAKKLYAYDAKARKLRVYVSAGGRGFLFKGTTLKNFDEEKSVCKTIRKPEAFFAALGSSPSISALNKAFKGVKAKEMRISSGGRFNENLILLKVSERE